MAQIGDFPADNGSIRFWPDAPPVLEKKDYFRHAGQAFTLGILILYRAVERIETR
jgi:hypothetical protein